ncbi:MAG: hypothetical protein MMC33_001909 [Icmadophila ericetorum]|nr:hypothetical protein [Icmadophila ericetorum]
MVFLGKTCVNLLGLGEFDRMQKRRRQRPPKSIDPRCLGRFHPQMLSPQHYYSPSSFPQEPLGPRVSGQYFYIAAYPYDQRQMTFRPGIYQSSSNEEYEPITGRSPSVLRAQPSAYPTGRILRRGHYPDDEDLDAGGQLVRYLDNPNYTFISGYDGEGDDDDDVSDWDIVSDFGEEGYIRRRPLS